MNKNRILIYILYFAFFIEVAFNTFWRGKFGIYISPVLLFVFSIAVGSIPLFLKPPCNRISVNTSKKGISIFLYYILFGAGSIISFLIFRNIVRQMPFDFPSSEVTTAIEVMSKRFLNSEFPYSLITEYGHNLTPTYLPFQWLPFTISSYFNFDHRYVVFAIWLISILLFTYSISKAKATLVTKLILICIPFITLIIFMLEIPTMFGVTIELLPSAYYIILTLTLLNSSLIIRSIGILLPLLSRFSFLFWLPFYFLLSFFTEKKYKSVITGVYVLILVGLFYLIPFLSKDPEIFSRGYDYYTKAALDEWHPHTWQNENDKPFQLFRGIGFASWFYQSGKGTVEHRLELARKTHMILTILTALAMGLLYLYFRRKVPDRLYLLLSLKIYLVVFYAFIQVPYIYLQLVPIFVSTLIIASVHISTRKGFISLPSLNEEVKTVTSP
ncbi:hypothetical protein ACFLRI_03170 [Bacteroidota bacterium]